MMISTSRPITETTTGADLFSEFKQGLASLNLTITKLCNITTYGAPNMFGRNHGFVGTFNKVYPTNDVVFIHSIIHQDV
jgi:hypothetical protein